MPRNYPLNVVESEFGDLEVVEHIASGGFKDVFLVRENGSETILKLLPVDSRSRLRRARRETDAMSLIDSPNFVNLQDGWMEEINGRDTYVMFEDYIQGETLADILDAGGAGIELGLDVAETILRVLVELDEEDLIHRDIKPSNIMIGEDGEIVLLDVGIVRFEEKESITPDGADRGPATPRYASPEQLNNKKGKQSIRTDLFSLGIVFFEAITGEHPFEGQSGAVTTAICTGEKKELESYISNPKLGEKLQLIFETMTETEPYERFRKPEFALEHIQEVKA